MAEQVFELAQKVLYWRRVVVMAKHVSRRGGCRVMTEYRPGFVVPGLKVHMGSTLTIEGRRSRSLASVFDLGLGIGLCEVRR